jgi:hypothetical protein
MSFDNPTPLRVGARGTLHGWTATVAGRVVLGVELSGERYYWNEFNLVDATGNSGTLVYEEGDDGPEWKLFQMITPRIPLTVAEAETKRVGDQVSFGDEPIPVTLVDRSTVYHIEGTAPEGVEIGDLADFFNADAGDHMIVASWTGNEIEFYEGRDVPAQTVATAFGLPRDALESRTPKSESGGYRFELKPKTWLAIIILILIGPCAVIDSCSVRVNPVSTTQEPAQSKQPAPALRLANGASGLLGGRTCTVDAHALVEVARIGGRFDRHEYHLTTGQQESVLLINGLTGGTRQWHLLRPVTPPADFTAYEAAARRKDSQFKLGGVTVTITELFLSQVRSVDGGNDAGLWPAAKQYGFVATGGGEWWLARWTERGLSLHRGTPLDEKIVFAALGPGPEKPK